MEIIKKIFYIIHRIESFVQISRTGHFEHFIVGSLIGGLISYLYFEKTNDKFKSIFLGISTALFVGLLKEYIDQLMGGNKSKLDLIYTVIGGVTGAAIFLLKTYIQKKKV